MDREKLKELKENLEGKKFLNDYEQGQLDAFKEALKPKKPDRLRIISVFIGLGILIITLVILTLFTYSSINDGSLSLETAAKDIVGQNEEVFSSKVIGQDHGVAFIDYNCRRTDTFIKGFKECAGRYYVFLNRVNNKWVVNESSKTIIW